MEVTKDWIMQSSLTGREKGMLNALLDDLDELNGFVRKYNGKDMSFTIDYQDWHDEYSPERTDPCPDYYGTYALVGKDGEIIGFKCTLEELDEQMCTVIEFAEYIFS